MAAGGDSGDDERAMIEEQLGRGKRNSLVQVVDPEITLLVSRDALQEMENSVPAGTAADSTGSTGGDQTSFPSKVWQPLQGWPYGTTEGAKESGSAHTAEGGRPFGTSLGAPPGFGGSTGSTGSTGRTTGGPYGAPLAGVTTGSESTTGSGPHTGSQRLGGPPGPMGKHYPSDGGHSYPRDIGSSIWPASGAGDSSKTIRRPDGQGGQSSWNAPSGHGAPGDLPRRPDPREVHRGMHIRGRASRR